MTAESELLRYVRGEGHVEDVALARIADAVGTPTYVYSRAALIRNYRRFQRALDGMRAAICYAVKANGNLAVVRTFAELGAGADVVSLGELKRALQAGVPAKRIVFAGVGKTLAEIDAALDAGILQFNVESEDELRTLSAAAIGRGDTAGVALRVNPDVDAKTHAKIATGRKGDKFGIDLAHAAAVAKAAAGMKGVGLHGLSVHIGSQLKDIAPFRRAFERMAELTRTLRQAGIAVTRLDLGGGIGVDYEGGGAISFADYARAVAETVGNLGCELVFEPGRALVADAGLLLTRVVRVKDGASRRFVITDAAMNDLVRPAMYNAYHPISPVKQPPSGAKETPMDVAGPICETGDQFAAQRPLPPILAGELLAILKAGAYGFAMASTYNLRPLPAEVMVHGTRFATVRARQDYGDLLGADILPDWSQGTTAEAPPKARGAA
ncbi:MAG: diaminopimelate decarboxylase [Rhodospirillales bacterium]